MVYYRIIGYVKEKGKQDWMKFKDNAIYSCKDNENPYIVLLKDFDKLFDHWLVDFQKVSINIQTKE